MAQKPVSERIARSLLDEGKITVDMLWRPEQADVQVIVRGDSLMFKPTRKARNVVRQHVRQALKPYAIFALCWFSRDVDLSSVPNANWLDRDMDGRSIVRRVAEAVILVKLMELTEGEHSEVLSEHEGTVSSAA